MELSYEAQKERDKIREVFRKYSKSVSIHQKLGILARIHGIAYHLDPFEEIQVIMNERSLGVVNANVVTTPAVEPKQSLGFKCEKCSQEFMSIKALNGHQYKHKER